MQEACNTRFKGLKEKHQDCDIELLTLSMIISDLKRYHAALDFALMQYHAHKMEQINNSLRFLWQQIYKGNDLDNIFIRSSTEATTESSGAGSRSYNYRVVMRKGDAELDMRGRCSAGQKVLACLVIRLALAESFATQCGVLTLDEPTTNLDRKNVESLARAMGELIRSKGGSSNFQLVLITHDEEFVEILRNEVSIEHYYQVRKDDDGHSNIRLIKFGL
eukprot:Gregarina_sp_Poly_1__829@NODE_119_length_13600_cov_173_393926_g106_i0_p5_GENE_NODE_119_length_13600_cov_173_393926_g106_i0NODE_119_length_13600_cov_173_393926_g106_i0_p5_ORF_typecomplete_len220_score17_40SbcCD_C/PF13558_6/1_2e12AAA_13/PF13166_6/3_4e09SMC_N/PF02463_19/2_7e09AAA_21/PF13304_6/1_7e08AAA_15/PF13175_6/0_00011IL12/PF03039_14/0_091ABC_tran/PF00005_27/0_15_NODE_119_length_13600_cov_173_393926_g106_i018722531